MGIQEDIQWIIAQLQKVDDPAVLQRIKELLANDSAVQEPAAEYEKEAPSATENSRISIEQYNRELDEAVARVNAGEAISHAAMKESMAQWRTK